jgi:hypothetical protein
MTIGGTKSTLYGEQKLSVRGTNHNYKRNKSTLYGEQKNSIHKTNQDYRGNKF